jgi:hypothetical protein
VCGRAICETCLRACLHAHAAASLSPHLRVVVVTGMQQHQNVFTCFESAFLALPPPPKQEGTFISSRALGFLSAVFCSASFAFAGHLWRYFVCSMLCITRQIELDAAEISCQRHGLFQTSWNGCVQLTTAHNHSKKGLYLSLIRYVCLSHTRALKQKRTLKLCNTSLTLSLLFLSHY